MEKKTFSEHYKGREWQWSWLDHFFTVHMCILSLRGEGKFILNDS